MPGQSRRNAYFCSTMKSCCKDTFSNADGHLEPKRPGRVRVWLKRIGIAGFIFFLLKGLAWVIVLWGGAKMIGCG
jgi:hypothetical protein